MIDTLLAIQSAGKAKDSNHIYLYTSDHYEINSKHQHAFVEIVMPLHNQLQFLCCNQEFHLRERDIMIIAPDTEHSVKACASRNLVVLADLSLLCNIKEFESALSAISPAILILPESFPEIHAKIHRLLLDISDEYFNNASLSEALIYSKLIEIFVLVGRNYNSCSASVHNEGIRRCDYSPRFLYICDYINLHYNENITLDFAAAMSGYSKYHFSRLFKQYTNVSFYKYLNQKKIENAEVLLMDHDLSITEVALRCGFRSLSAFLRMFKLIKGCTPSEYKQT